MKALIVYYSMSGNAGLAAKRIAEQTGADMLSLQVEKDYPDKGFKKYFWGGKSAVMGDKPKLQPYVFEADKYDTVIFGTPVWASTFAPPLRTFIEDNRSALRQKRMAAFVCFKGSGDQKAFAKLKKLLDIESLAAEMTLTEPKEQNKADVDAKIGNFCQALAAAEQA